MQLTLREAEEQFRRSYLEEVIQGRSVPEAARIAGMNKTAFYNVLKKFGLTPYKGNGRRGNWNGTQENSHCR